MTLDYHYVNNNNIVLSIDRTIIVLRGAAMKLFLAKREEMDRRDPMSDAWGCAPDALDVFRSIRPLIKFKAINGKYYSR